MVQADPKLVRFFLPILPTDPEQPVWSVIRKLSDQIGELLTTHLRAISRSNPLLQGIIDRVDFNATIHGQRDLDDDRLSPSRYIHSGDAETYRPIGEIVAELDAIETEAKETDKALREILEKLGV